MPSSTPAPPAPGTRCPGRLVGPRPLRAVLGRPGLTALLSLAVLVGGAACTDYTDPPKPRPWPSGTPLTWQFQLTGDPDVTADADVFALDAFNTPADALDRLRGRGKRTICYVDAGAWQKSAPDADRFPTELLGASTGRTGERWVDVRQWGLLEPILADRFRLCRGKGFNAVATAHVDGYAHDPGLALTFDDQLAYNRRLAALIRSIGLSPGLVNDVDQVAALEPDFDFAVNEGCFAAGECDRLLPFVAAGKPVFHVEYDEVTATFCPTTLGLGFASIHKERDLGAWRAPCLP